MEVRDVWMHELSMPETPKRREDLRRRSEKDLTVGFYLEWTWTHGCVPRASGSRRKARVVGPDDVVKSDVDPPERATCHRGCG
jgi:hypothetical protein